MAEEKQQGQQGTGRPDLGFAGVLDSFDPEEWQGRSGEAKALPPEVLNATRRAAEKQGFASREAWRSKPRVLTGRSAQFNVRAKPSTIATFHAIAKERGWILGETLERAVELLVREYGEGGRHDASEV